MELRNTKNNVFLKALLILMIFCLFVTGCRQNIDTNPDNNDEDTKITNPDNNGGDTNIDVTNPDNNAGDANTNATNPDNTGGDTNTNAGAVLENGFKPSNFDESPIFHCAYKSDKTHFDIDDVTLDFFYGGYYYQGVEHQLENMHDFPYFELYFEIDGGEELLIKRVEENFISEEYSCDFVYDENWYITEIKYNHSETITIPKEIFTEDNGLIYFAIYGENVKEPEQQTKFITGIGMYYKVIGEQVVLSRQPVV